MLFLNPTNLVGTSATASDLTNAFTGNTQSIATKGLDRIRLGVHYTPGANNQWLEMTVEESDDNVNFTKYEGRIGTTTEVQEYDEEFKIPGDGASTAGTAIRQTVNLIDLASKYMKFSFREHGATTPTVFGTLFCSEQSVEEL